MPIKSHKKASFGKSSVTELCPKLAFGVSEGVLPKSQKPVNQYNLQAFSSLLACSKCSSWNMTKSSINLIYSILYYFITVLVMIW
jgi:hypothetical protein